MGSKVKLASLASQTVGFSGTRWDRRLRLCFKQRCTLPNRRNGGLFSNSISARPIILQQPPTYSPTPSNNNTEPRHARQDGSNLLYTPKTEAFEPDSYSTPYLDQQVESKTEDYHEFVEHAQPVSGFASFAHREEIVHPHSSLSPLSHIYQPLSPSPHPSMTLAEHRVHFQPSHQTQFYSPRPVHFPFSPTIESSTFTQSLATYPSHYGTEGNLNKFSFAPAPRQRLYTPHRSSLPMVAIFSALSAPSPLSGSHLSPVPGQTTLVNLVPPAVSANLSAYSNLTTSEAHIPSNAQHIHHTDSITSVVDSIPHSLAEAHQDMLVSHLKKKQKRRKFEQKHYKVKGKEAIRFLEDMAEILIEGEIDPLQLPKRRKALDDRLSAQVSQNRIYHNQPTKNS